MGRERERDRERETGRERPREGENIMCQTCANIVRKSHFEKLGQHHFVSLIDKRAPDGKVSSKDFYKSVISKTCGPCQKKIIKHHMKKLPTRNKVQVVSAITTELALGTTTTPRDEETEEFERMKAKLIFKWPKTLIDKLGFNHIKAPPLEAKMMASAPPCHTSAARRIPHNYLEKAGEMIETLLKEGVIERSPEATPWTSPAFFIPKNQRDKLRFIVDLSYLNGFLIRSVHEFPTPHAIVTAIASTATVFCCMDLKDGYFQVLLSPELSALTSFILPAELKKYSGKFKFLRCPQGLSVSGDAFVRLTDEALFNSGCPGAKFNSQVFKCVDDILVAAVDKTALLNTCDEILRRLEAKNIKVSKSKIVIGKKVDYCGYVISDKGISPNEDRITALKHMTPPTTVGEPPAEI